MEACRSAACTWIDAGYASTPQLVRIVPVPIRIGMIRSSPGTGRDQAAAPRDRGSGKGLVVGPCILPRWSAPLIRTTFPLPADSQLPNEDIPKLHQTRRRVELAIEDASVTLQGQTSAGRHAGQPRVLNDLVAVEEELQGK